MGRARGGRKRIALGGIATESCTFSPLPTRLEHFRVREGALLLDEADYPFLATTAAAVLPTLQARAIPGGTVAREAYEALKARFLARLEAALPLDGLYLDMHGAMNVAGMDDAEGDWYQAARAVVGPGCLIAASYDLHGNLSPRILATLDLLTAFRTAPHVDDLETRSRAFALLERALREGLRPGKVWVPVPVIVSGERSSTEYEPAASLYAALEPASAAPGVLDASILVGYLWADEPRVGASVVLTGTDGQVLRREAERLAEAYWARRADFDFAVPHGSIDEAIDWALARPERGLIVSDSGDNPTAGGVGDRADVLRRLLARGVSGALVGGLTDPAATVACYAAGVGAAVSVRVGGALAPGSSAPLELSGEVVFLDETSEERERQAVLKVAGVHLVLAQARRPYHREADFLRLGLDPQRHKLTVVKLGYLVPDLKRIARGAFLALSPGAVDQAATRLPYRRLRRPFYPFDPDFAWASAAQHFPPKELP